MLLSTDYINEKGCFKAYFKFLKDIHVSEIDSVMIEKYLSFRKKRDFREVFERREKRARNILPDGQYRTCGFV